VFIKKFRSLKDNDIIADVVASLIGRGRLTGALGIIPGSHKTATLAPREGG
jgi:hypothetical protein